jgi:hypothetical protein
MTKQTRNTLKGYFETGDVPNQQNYADVMDSFVNLLDTDLDPQHIKSGISSSGILFVGSHITASGNISASGVISGSSFITTGSIVASGNISSSLTGSFNILGVGTDTPGEQLEVIGNISASGFISASSFSGVIDAGAQATITTVGTLESLTVTGDITANGNIIGDDGTDITNIQNLSLDTLSADANPNTNVEVGGTALNFNVDGTETLAMSTTTLTSGMILDLIGTTDASDATGDTGTLRCEGGASIAKKVYIGTDLDVNGTSNLNNTDVDGTLVVDGTNISLDSTTTLNIDNSNTSNGITIGTATSGVPISIGHTTSTTTINDNLTVTGNYSSTNGNIDLTNGVFKGDNIGPYLRDKILLLPTDFSVSNNGTAQVYAEDGAFTKPTTTAQKYVASYVVPSGMTPRFIRIYSSIADVVTATVFENNITNGVSSTLCSDVGSSTGETACGGSAGDGLKYLTVQLTWSSATRTFFGGYITML